MHWGVFKRHLRIIRKLLMKGANETLTNIWGETAFEVLHEEDPLQTDIEAIRVEVRQEKERQVLEDNMIYSLHCADVSKSHASTNVSMVQAFCDEFPPEMILGVMDMYLGIKNE